jgi:hypothetical protein
VRLVIAVAALALTGCASSRLPAETPAGTALDVATSVRDTAAQTAGAANAGVTPERLQALWGDAVEAEDEVLKAVPSGVAAKAPLLAAAAATRSAAEALSRVGGRARARAQLARAQARLGQVADALAPQLPDRALALERLREPLV